MHVKDDENWLEESDVSSESETEEEDSGSFEENSGISNSQRNSKIFFDDDNDFSDLDRTSLTKSPDVSSFFEFLIKYSPHN